MYTYFKYLRNGFFQVKNKVLAKYFCKMHSTLGLIGTALKALPLFSKVTVSYFYR